MASPATRVLKRIWPWLAGLAILVAVATRMPMGAFRDALGKGPHLRLAIVEAAIAALVLCSDSWSSWVGLVALRMRRPLRDVFAVRGATYLLFLINYALGQGGFGYYLHRSGETVRRAAGAVLFLIGTNFATLLLLTAIGMAVAGTTVDATLYWVIVFGLVGFAAYLAVIAIGPHWLARRPVLEPLFDAGLGGHALAVAGRIPHVTIVMLGHWVAMRAWGLDVPFVHGMLLMPAVAIATVLPISPAGLGTTQAAIVYFFADYGVGLTSDDRAASVFVFAVVHFVYGIIMALVLGAACFPFAKRRGISRHMELARET
ncbi:MAG TPA: hypothetical protein VGO00_07815 [Kofleriaceae bacterium]|nr:hypothetical protein [Kofleriaceae bacterium]